MKKRKILFGLLITFLFVFLIACDENDNSGNGDSFSYPKVLEIKLSGDNLIDEDHQTAANLVGLEEDLNLQQEQLNYYTNVNRELELNIVIENPDDFFIDSFKLNDTLIRRESVLASSTNELIKYKITSPELAGVYHYEVNEVNFQTLTNIYNAEIIGSSSFTLGVKETNLPVITNFSETVSSSTLSLNFQIRDERGLILSGGNNIKIALYENDVVKETKDLNLGDNDVLFEGLTFNNTYNYLIYTSYDVFDGSGNRLRVLKEEDFLLSALEVPSFRFIDVEILEEEVKFKIFKDDPFDLATLITLKLYDEYNELIETITNFESPRFIALMSNVSYKIVLAFQYDLNDGNGVVDDSYQYFFTTKETPITITKLTANKESINSGEVLELTASLANPSNLVITALYVNNERIAVSDAWPITFSYQPLVSEGSE